MYVHVPCGTTPGALCGLSTAGAKSAARAPYHPSEASVEGFVHPLKETHNFHILHRDAHLKNVHLNILLLEVSASQGEEGETKMEQDRTHL